MVCRPSDSGRANTQRPFGCVLCCEHSYAHGTAPLVTAPCCHTERSSPCCRPPVIHRDLKPENVILEQGQPGGRVLLVDFGGVQEATAASADPAGGAPPLGSTIIGTAGYMPPEQFAGAASPASDLYALGGVLLFLLSGRTPGQFKSERLRVSFEREVEVGARMSALLAALLDPIAEDRPTASQVPPLLCSTDADTAPE